MPSIGREFNVSVNRLRWIITAYGLTLAGFLTTAIAPIIVDATSKRAEASPRESWLKLSPEARYKEAKHIQDTLYIGSESELKELVDNRYIASEGRIEDDEVESWFK